MKKLTTLFASLVIVSFLSFNAFAQGVNIGIGGGLTQITGPASYTNKISEGGFGFTSAYNLGIKAKINIPLSPITPIGYFSYTFLRNSESLTAGEVKYSENIISVGVGGELSILPIPGPLSPYICLDVAYNKFGDVDREAPLLYGGNKTITGVSRYGLDLGVGTQVNLLVLKLDASLKYHLYNLFGKESGEENVTGLTLDVYLML